MPRLALITTLAGLAVLVPARPPVPEPGPDVAPAAREGSPTGEQLPPFLRRLRRRAAVYRRAVLQFTCTEVLLEEDVAPWTGAPRWRRQATYRYLLQPRPDRRIVAEYRQILSRDGVPVRQAPAVVQTATPPPYLWAALLDPDYASLFRFEIVGTEKRGVTETVIIGFEGQLAYQEGHRLAEWSGRLWIDRDLLDPVHLEAEPARQDAALAVRLDRYRRAFRLAGIPFRRQPRVHALSVDFLVNYPTGLSFPSMAIWRRQVVNAHDERGTERMIQRRFSDYGLFDIETDEIIKSLQDPADETSPPPVP